MWRRIMISLCLLIVFSLWLYVIALGFPLRSLEDTILDDPLMASAWAVVALAALLAFLSFHGTMPDRFSAYILVGVAINILSGNLAVEMDSPFFFDTMGTMLAGIIGGPVMAVATALITVCVWGFNTPIVIPHVMSAITVAIFVGVAGVDRRLGTIGSVMRVGLITGLVSGIFASMTVNIGLARTALKGTTDFANFFIMIRFDPDVAFVIQSLISDPIDKIFSLLFVCLFVRLLAPQLIKALGYWGNEERLTSVLRGPDKPLLPFSLS